jgi:hypothetical protein
MGESDEVGNALTATVAVSLQLKILYSVIGSIAVAVVHVLVFGQ